MSKIHTANLAYGFIWACRDNMPDISILDLFPEDELEEYLEMDWKSFELDRQSYYTTDFDDFMRLLNRAFDRLSAEAGYKSTPIAVYPVGEDDYGQYSHVCIVANNTVTHASFNNAVPVSELATPAYKEFLDMIITRYFPKAEPGWLLWPYSTV